LDHMANMTQVFLGTSIQCAQCHDHPFDKWSQHDFFAMAVFTYGAKTDFPETKNTKEAIVDRFGKKLSNEDRSAIVATIGSALKYSARRAVHNYGVDTIRNSSYPKTMDPTRATRYPHGRCLARKSRFATMRVHEPLLLAGLLLPAIHGLPG